MYIVKVRRVGNSNVITLPKELEASGYVAGASVLIERLPDGQLRMARATSLSPEQWRGLAESVVAADREALDKLAAYDRGELLDTHVDGRFEPEAKAGGSGPRESGLCSSS